MVSEKDYEKVNNLIYSKKYDEALNEIHKLMETEKNYQIETDTETRYCFTNYIELLIYFYYYKPTKKNVKPEVDMARLYFLEGCIYSDLKDEKKARDKYYESRRWNPVKVATRINEALTYRPTDLEEYRRKIQETYKYIYQKSDFAIYLFNLGVYFYCVNMSDVARAAFTVSLYYGSPRKGVYTYLEKIQEIFQDGKLELNINDAVEILEQYSVPINIDSNIIKILADEYNRLLEKNDRNEVYYLSETLYDLTKDKKYVFFDRRKSNNGVEVAVPSVVRILGPQMSKDLGYNESDLIMVYKNRIIKLSLIGKMDKDSAEKKYSELIKNIENSGQQIYETKKIEQEQTIYQILCSTEGNKNRIIYNVIYVNGFVLIATWDTNYLGIPNINLDRVNKNILMDMVRSIKYNEVDAEQVQPVSGQNSEMQIHVMEVEKYPKIQIELPRKLGNMEKVGDRSFKFVKDNINIEIKLSKFASEENFISKIKEWTENIAKKTGQEIVEYKKENLNGNLIEVYVLQNKNGIKKLYKNIYFSKCSLTIIGTPMEDTEKIIDIALNSIKLLDGVKGEPTISKQKSEINSESETEKNIKLAKSQYEKGNIKECIHILNDDIKKVLEKDPKLKDDVFWREMPTKLYTAIILNKFYKNKDISSYELKKILLDKNTVVEEIREYINNFKGKAEYDKSLEGIEDKKMLDEFIKILLDNIPDSHMQNNKKTETSTQQLMYEYTKMANYKLHAQQINWPLLKEFQVQNLDNQPPDIIMFASRAPFFIQVKSMGPMLEKNLEQMIANENKASMNYLKQSNCKRAEDSIFYYKDYNNGTFNFKIYVVDMIEEQSFKRFLSAYFVEPKFKDVYQVSVLFSFAGKPENFKPWVVDLENDELTKYLNDMLTLIMDNIKYK